MQVRGLAESSYGRNLAAILERTKVALGSGSHTDMLQVFAGIDVQNAAQHSNVCADGFILGLPEGPYALEDMGRVKVADQCGGIGGQKVDAARNHVAGPKCGAARRAGDLPAAEIAQMPDQVQAEDAGRSDDERALLLYGNLHFAQSVISWFQAKSLKGHK